LTWWPSTSLSAFRNGRLEARVPEGEGARPLHLPIGVRVGRRAVHLRAGHVDVAPRDREVERLGGAAHGEQEAAVLDVLPDALRDRLLHRRHRAHAVLLAVAIAR
jgi:hypothetical protein